MSRYQTQSSEAQYQPDSGEQVLKNHIGVKEPTEMDDIEANLLSKLYERVFTGGHFPRQLRFGTLASWHRQWLGNVYPWAGQVRNVELSKGGFRFTSPKQIGPCLRQFESAFLNQYPEVSVMPRATLIHYLAQSHVELILIHPFREGNGRISRLLIDVLCQQAGLGLLDYRLWEENKDFYVAAIQAGVGHDYQHMERLIDDILPRHPLPISIGER
ncbi:cell filamentation protein Fic [Salinivibrio kushneri]|uniref:protein adenylyltransferase n=1 Tax=Salinivibrio kushneri TaxID=1908198 RepID=A0AB36K5U7_9GAMM|nr:Fic family protein [Salinivibrio kushneri]OOE43741.1 cell filamentation protein Fic [Salinivibrio kushneri]OOE46028.1 cell filamentation protein Fic [Salinivibrio kushneri]